MDKIKSLAKKAIELARTITVKEEGDHILIDAFKAEGTGTVCDKSEIEKTFMSKLAEGLDLLEAVKDEAQNDFLNAQANRIAYRENVSKSLVIHHMNSFIG